MVLALMPQLGYFTVNVIICLFVNTARGQLVLPVISAVITDATLV